METIALGNIGRFQSGGTPSKKEASYYGGDIPWITTVALNGKIIDEKEATDWLTEEGVKNSATKVVPAFSLMVGTRVGVGKVAINKVDMCTNQDIISIIDIDKEKWDMDYLRFFVLSSAIKLNSLARGATIKGVKLEVLQKLKIPKISREEQKYIATVLGGVQEVIEAETNQLEYLDILIKARFVEMINLWKNELVQAPLSDFLELITYGFTNPMPDAEEGPYKVTAKDVIKGKVNYSTARKTPQEDFDKLTEKSIPKVGDVLLTKDGTLGRTAVVERADMCINQSVALLRCNSLVLPEFLNSLLQMPEYQREMMKNSGGGTIKHLYITRVDKMIIVMPSIERQKQWIDLVKQVDKSKVA